MRVVTLRGRVSFWDHCVRGSVLMFFRDVVRILCIFSFLFFLRYIVLVHEVLWPFIDIYCTYFLFYIVDVCFSFTYPFICCLFSLFIYMLLIICIQSIIYVSHKDSLMSFCLKCFRNTGCQSLLAINSLLANFFQEFVLR